MTYVIVVVYGSMEKRELKFFKSTMWGKLNTLREEERKEYK